MRKGKKALLIAAAMILTIATLAVLNFVRSKMEADEAFRQDGRCNDRS